MHIEALLSGAYESGGVPLAANAAAVPTESTGLELIGATEEVATIKAKALEPQAEDKAQRGLETAPQGGTTECERESVLLPRETSRVDVLATLEKEGTCKPKKAPPWKVIQTNKAF